ncbi:hypothetical protein Tco_0287979, partial [Tanacetum coccineum]
KSGLGLPSIVALGMVFADKRKPIEWIGDHITDNGWDPLYTVWDKHGEPAPPTPPPPPPLMSDMTSLLDDLSYIPPNNEHNEPTQGDIGETSNEPTQATRNEFEELYSSANEALYPGCDHVGGHLEHFVNE